METYFEHWEDSGKAYRSLLSGISRYCHSIDLEKTPLPPVDDYFAVDQNSNAISELVDLYEDLTVNSRDHGAAMLAASRQLFDRAILKMPARHLEVLIYGSFLISAAPKEYKPDPSTFLRTLRPLLRDEALGVRDRYFNALSTVCDVAVAAVAVDREAALDALKTEWDYMTSIGEAMPSGVARAICATYPIEWPDLLSSVVEGIWPRNALVLGDNLRPLFASAVQNLSRDIPLDIVASELHRLLPSLDANAERARLLMACLFVVEGQVSEFGVSPPFELRSADSEDPPPLECWSVTVGAATASRNIPSRELKISGGDLNSFARSLMIKYLVGASVSLEAALVLADVA